MLAEVSDPSVCHGGCQTQFIFSRVSLVTPLDYYVEVGWTEATRGPATGDTQQIQTVTAQGTTQTRLLWGTVLPDRQYAFRADHCGLPGEHRVCMEMWNGSSWMLLGSPYEAMRCLNADGTFNCSVNIYTEVSSATQTYFDLNGGPDGLRTQNIEVKRDWWDLFVTSDYPPQAPRWVAQAPYTICQVFDHYHFTVFRGAPAC